MLMNNSKEVSTTEMFALHYYPAANPNDIAKMMSPRVLTTHYQFQDLPVDFIAQKRKLVLVRFVYTYIFI